MTYERTLTVNRNHPALPGHFPGHPIVPGVVVLEEVIETLRETYGQELVVTGMPAVKLSSPLRPEERLTITVECEEADLAAFTCQVGSRLVATGSIRFRVPGGTRSGS